MRIASDADDHLCPLAFNLFCGNLCIIFRVSCSFTVHFKSSTGQGTHFDSFVLVKSMPILNRSSIAGSRKIYLAGSLAHELAFISKHSLVTAISKVLFKRIGYWNFVEHYRGVWGFANSLGELLIPDVKGTLPVLNSCMISHCFVYSCLSRFISQNPWQVSWRPMVWWKKSHLNWFASSQRTIESCCTTGAGSKWTSCNRTLQPSLFSGSDLWGHFSYSPQTMSLTQFSFIFAS